MQTTFTIRRFGPSDLDDVMKINQTCLPENYSSYFFNDLFERYPATFIVAELEGRLVGYIMCRIEAGLKFWGPVGFSRKGHVVSIAVLSKYRRRGVGSALLTEAMRNLHIYKAKECFLEVRTSNKNAVDMYRKLGFQIVRTKHEYYADGESAFVMAKKLSD